jgi:glycosyltransferase involved in cell wall biosynthesis
LKICMLTSGHEIYDNRIYYKEILSLAKNYDDISLVGPGDKDFITSDGIKVFCFPKKRSWYDRIRPMKQMYTIASKIDADVYHAHEPDSLQVAIKLKKNKNCKIVYDSHEYYPEAFSEHFKFFRRFFTKLVYLYEKSMAKKADLIITVNDILIDKFKKYNENSVKLPNYPVLNEASCEKKLDPIPSFVYVGGLREDRGIIKVLEAIKLTKIESKFIFIGNFENEDFKLKVQEYIKDNLKDKNIVFTGQIPHLEVFNYLKSSIAGFVLLQPNNWRYVNSEPIKLFEYMMTKNIVISSNFPMMKKIIDEAECGYAVDPTDEYEIKDAIEKVAINMETSQQMGESGYQEILKRYNWKICERALLMAYKALE